MKKKRYRWNRTLISAAGLVLWCQTAGRFGLVVDGLVFPKLLGQDIAPFGWMMIIGSACLITSRQVRFKTLLKPTIRMLYGMLHLWPEWLSLGLVCMAAGFTVISWTVVIKTAGWVLCEEAVFRMMFCSYCLRKDADLDGKTIAFVSSALWGAAHLLNLSAGMPALSVSWQCISAFGIGLFMGIIFLRTGSVWPMTLAHFAHNLVGTMIDGERPGAFMGVGGLSGKARLAGSIYLTLCLLWLYILWADTKRKEIDAIWELDYNTV